MREIGSGATGRVFKCSRKSDQALRAIKVIMKDDVPNPKTWRNEYRILMEMDHPHIIKLYEVYESSDCLYLVLELCDGGELFSQVSKKHSMSEQEVSIIMRQIVSAIGYCHKFRIGHRDIKAENFLLKG